MDITAPNIVESVLIFLIFLSVLIWAVGISKYVSFMQYARADRAFLRHFSGSSHVSDLDDGEMNQKGRLARVCHAGLAELDLIQTLEGKVSNDEKREILNHALEQQAHVEQVRMENGLSILASVGSTAPFIGLFGTVWGIMNALKEITASGSASLDVVAGPIGEALIATAVGIATAVPAVLAYNYFLRKVRLSSATMDNFASAFQLLALKSGAISNRQIDN
ncbi:MotA/TolQ/ExbB proton channel family protein [uncultured Methylophaga sp.]|uniref:MotA/TolQ/ExbB proton channel family protein n=1 Tax=uncultured Methylophaga sp. TaxID=285271 RepID=UPI00260E28A9|nr:MotA/TolQ/ExbB proton channel family protein [uncultured Methylophaga sp.]